MIKKITTSLLVLTPFCFTHAQDSTATETKSNFAVSGYVDAYYRFNFSNPKKEYGTTNNLTSFTNSHNSFELGMASVKLEHSMGKVGVVADLGFGTRADEFSYADRVANVDAAGGTADLTSRFVIKQAYITYAPKENLKFTAGSFATHVGYELVDPYLNRNYSMSYMFSYGPFLHTGVKADLTAGKSGFMLGISNPTDLKSASFARKFLIGQYSYGGEKVKLYLNYQGGTFDSSTKINQIDAVITGAISDKFSIGYNGTVQGVKTRSDYSAKFGESDSWWGSALYLNADPTSSFGLTLRGEYFDNKKGVLGALPSGNIFETTLSANFKINGLTIIPELRLDNADTEVFINRSGESQKSTLSGLIAAIYKF
jgi:putative OmpL-like beta-barrel porin-2